MASKRAWIYPDPDSPGHYFLGFTYNGSFVEALKKAVPHYYRSYQPSTKLWWLDEAYLPEVTQLAKIFFDTVEIKEAPPETERSPEPTNPYSVLHLLPSAPPQLVKAAYRTLAKINHPDAGGDLQKMQLLNRAYELIEGRYGN